MREISARFKAALGVSHKRATTITVTVPGGEPVEIGPSARLPNGARGPGWSSVTVGSSNSTGVRYYADLTITPAAGYDTYALVSTPGAIFDIDHGIDFGGGDVELVDCGEYEAASGGVNIIDGDVSLRLVDLWQRVERCRFTSAYAPAAATRASGIATAVGAAIPTVTTSITADGGSFLAGNVWDRDRTQFINDMARDGSLDAAFDAAGVFRIRTQPILNAAVPAWTFRTGATSNIITAERERPFDRLYNMVIVSPIDETQTWARQTVSLEDPDHPRHPDKIGEVPFFFSSPTLKTDSAARAAGATILQRVLGTTETVSLGVLGNPALEVGDTVAIVHEATDTDPGFQASHLIDEFRMDLETGAMALATRSTALAELEES